MIKSAVLGTLQHARQAVPLTGVALAAGLAAPVVDGAPGDLDPAFADAGRLVLGSPGQVWSLELDDDGDGFLAGGNVYCGYFNCVVDGFTQPFSSAGLLDLDYAHPDLPGTIIRDSVRQPDGKAIGVGSTVTRQRFPPSTSALTVFRLLPDGTLDPTFGDAGRVQTTGARDSGTAVALDADEDAPKAQPEQS